MESYNTLRRTTLLVGSTLTVMAGAIIAPALPQISKIYGHMANAEFLSKLILTLPALFIALLAPLAGMVVDNAGRRKVLLFSLLLYAVAGTTGAYFSNIYLILAGRAFLGIAVGGIMTAIVTLIGDYFQGAQRSKFMGYQAAFSSTGGLLFITTGGMLTDVHWRFPFLIYAVSILVMVMAWISIYEPDRPAKVPGQQSVLPASFLKTIPPQVFWVYAIAFFSFAVFYMVPVQMPFMLSALGDISNTGVGIAIACMNITAMLTAFNYSRFKKQLDFPVIMGIVFLLVAAGYVIISLAKTYEMMLAGILTCGLGFGMQMANINLWLVQLAPGNIRGTLVGYLNTFIFMGMFLSPVLLQPLINISSLYGSFLIVALILVCIAAVFFVTARQGAWRVYPGG